jgi:hypothetical protein
VSYLLRMSAAMTELAPGRPGKRRTSSLNGVRSHEWWRDRAYAALFGVTFGAVATASGLSVLKH